MGHLTSMMRSVNGMMAIALVKQRFLIPGLSLIISAMNVNQGPSGYQQEVMILLVRFLVKRMQKCTSV